MRRLIFLDIDGVLNHDDWFRGRSRPREKSYFEYVRWSMDPECIGRLNTITDITGARIVLSSSWRYLKTWQETAECMAKIGLRGSMIDRTPIDPEVDGGVFERYRGRPPHSAEPYPRGYEIQQWLDQNPSPMHDRYVILDDDGDMEHLAPRLIQTDAERGGLQYGHVQRAIKLLE